MISPILRNYKRPEPEEKLPSKKRRTKIAKDMTPRNVINMEFMEDSDAESEKVINEDEPLKKNSTFRDHFTAYTVSQEASFNASDVHHE